MNYSILINQLRSSGMVEEDEFVIVCKGAPSTLSALFGAIGVAFSSAAQNHFLLSVGKNRLQLFDIDKKTGKYAGTMTKLPIEDILKLKVSTFLMNEIAIKVKNAKYHLMTSVKFKNFDQKETVNKAMSLLKTMKK